MKQLLRIVFFSVILKKIQVKLFTVVFYKKNWFQVSILLIITLAFILRFYNFENRYALAGDQARDALIALESVRTNKIPVIGPFSSVGNFTTGQTWYLWLAVTSAIFPYSFLTPFVVLTASYVLVVFLIILSGYELGGKKLAIIAGILSAFSPAQIIQSGNLTNPTLVALFSVSSLYFAIKYVKSGRNYFAFLFPFFIGLGISTHFQSVYLLFLIPIAFSLKLPSVKKILLAGLGLAIPFVSYVIFDITHKYYNSRGIIDYLLYGQYKIYIPNRWLTYALQFWPEMWSKIIGGEKLLGYFAIACLTVAIPLMAFKKLLSRPLILVVFAFFLIFFSLRFYRGERFDGYFVFTHPFVLILTAWITSLIFKVNRIAGLFIIIVLCVFSFKTIFHLFNQPAGYTHLQADYWSNLFIKTFPDKKFQVYALTNSNESFSLPLVLYLNQKGKINDEGYKIGFGSPDFKYRKFHKELENNEMGYQLWDLDSSSSAELIKEGWHKINPSEVYKTSAEWYRNIK